MVSIICIWWSGTNINVGGDTVHYVIRVDGEKVKGCDSMLHVRGALRHIRGKKVVIVRPMTNEVVIPPTVWMHLPVGAEMRHHPYISIV